MALWIHSLSFYRGSIRMTTSQGRIVFKTRMPTSCQVYKNLLMGDWPILCSRKQALQGPPRTRQRIAACQSLTAKILFKDPEVLFAAELGLWPWRLQEQAHGASMRAPSQWGAQSGCRQRPHQLDDVKLDGSNKAEAACQVEASIKPTSVPMLGMFFPRLPFLVGTAVLPRRLKKFRCQREMGPRETTPENEILFYPTSTYIVGNMPSTDVLRNKSKWIILLIIWNTIGQEILANFVVR